MATPFCTRSACLRATTQHARTFAAPIASFTSSVRPLKQQRLSYEPTRSIPSVALKIPAARFSQPLVNRRHASTESPAGAPVQPSSQPAATPTEILTWDHFFDLRKKKRYINLVASIFTGAATFLVAAPLITEYEVDAYLAQISGLDPMITLGMTAIATAVGGSMCGPALGNTAFKMWASSKGLSKAVAEKEKSFYARIKRYRCDPRHGSPQNPVPDYYGEKIGSVANYRSWLKDQRAFNRKKDRPLSFKIGK